MRLKVLCTDVILHNYGNDSRNCEVVFRPVEAGDGGENDEFNRLTPWGELTVGLSEPEPPPGIEAGKEYYVDFRLVGG